MTEAPKAAQPFRTVLGAVEVINTEKRTVSVISVDGISNLMRWGPGYLDEKMGKLKEGYYREFSCEVQGEDLRITSVKYLDSPDWVKARFKGKGGGGGGKSYTPRNEKPIIYQCCYKEACETARRTFLPELSGSMEPEKLYQHIMDIALARAKKDAAELIKESGA